MSRRMVCTGCEQPLPRAAAACAGCGAAVASEIDAPLHSLREVVDRLLRGDIPMTRERVEGLAGHVMGIGQQALDAARETLEENLADLRAAHEPTDRVDLIERFDAAQRLMDQALMDASDILTRARSPHDLVMQRGRLDHAAARVQQACGGLHAVVATSADPVLAAPMQPPVPVEAMDALAAIEVATADLGEWLGRRDPTLLERALLALDEARERLAGLVGRKEEA